MTQDSNDFATSGLEPEGLMPSADDYPSDSEADADE
jgi:hypothetical protein